MNDQRARIAQVRHMAKDLKAVDQFHTGVIAALDRKGEKPARALGTDLLHPLVIGRGFQSGIGNIPNSVVLFEPFRHLHRVLHMPLHAQRQGLDPHQCVMGRLRVHRHPQVAQPDGDAVEGKGHGAEGLVELHAVIGFLRLAERGEFVIRGPVEFARIHDAAAHDGAVAGEVFGGGMHHQRRAMLNRAAEVGRGAGVVDDQRNARRICHIRNSAHIHDIAAGVCDGLTKDRAGVVVDRIGHGLRIVEIDKLAGPAEPLDRMAELGDRAAIETGGGDDILARPHQREQRHDLRRMPR